MVTTVYKITKAISIFANQILYMKMLLINVRKFTFSLKKKKVSDGGSCDADEKPLSSSLVLFLRCWGACHCVAFLDSRRRREEEEYIEYHTARDEPHTVVVVSHAQIYSLGALIKMLIKEMDAREQLLRI